MYICLLNITVVLLFLGLSVRRLFRNPIDQVLAVFSLFWGVAVTSGLILSFFYQLGNSWAWFASSLLIGISIFVTTSCRAKAVPMEDSPTEPILNDIIKKNSRFDVWVIGIVTASLLLINIIVAMSYPPTNWDTNTYHLPRAFFYMSQGNLDHFSTVNFRQIFLPFNPTLLIIWLTVFELSERLLALVNPFCWIICFLGVYRLSVLCGASKHSALIVAAIGCLAPEIYTQGASTTTDIQQASLIICSAVFLLLYSYRCNFRYILIASLSFGISAGIKVTCFFFGPIILLILLIYFFRNGSENALRFLNEKKYHMIIAVLLFLWFAVPFMAYNYMHSGVLMTSHYDYLRNKPFSIFSWLQTLYAFSVQTFVAPFKFLLNEQWLEIVSKQIFFPYWESKYAFNDLKIITPGISEDSLWYSFVPYFILLALVIELRRKTHWLRPSFIFLVAGLSWFVTYCAASKWGLYNQRYFISAVLLAMPSVAMLCDLFLGSNKIIALSGRYLIRLLILFLLFQSAICHRDNYYRPFFPIIQNKITSTALDILPPKMKDTLEKRKKVNIVQYSWQHEDERQYPFLRVIPDAQLSLKQYRMEQKPDVPPESLTGFNLISLWGTAEGSFLSSIPASKGWIVIPIENKKTCGVKPLGYIGNWYTDYFKYFSFEPGQKPCPLGEDNILFLALHDRNPTVLDGKTISRFQKLRLLTIGLNNEDHLTLTVQAALSDGTIKTVWDASEDGYKDITLPVECTKLSVELKDADGLTKGRGQILAAPFTTKFQQHDIAHASIVHDLIPDEIITVKGMGATSEGPYPAMGLPKIRWSTDKEISFDFENNEPIQLENVAIELEFKPQAKGQIEISANHNEIASYIWNDTNWQTTKVKVPLIHGKNVIIIKTTFSERFQEILNSKNLLMFREIQFRGIPLKN